MQSGGFDSRVGDKVIMDFSVSNYLYKSEVGVILSSKLTVPDDRHLVRSGEIVLPGGADGELHGAAPDAQREGIPAHHNQYGQQMVNIADCIKHSIKVTGIDIVPCCATCC